ncbi:hypothetical protein ACFW9I_36150 [[Kitasatospora] papulosa]|uniref:hypothetical protein n=1 Tax=[Kitasatospora] papulosa TaxID=1464011 RepID=UPI003678ADE5
MGQPRDVELGAQGAHAVLDQVVSGVADQGGDRGVDRGGPQVESGQEVAGQVEFVISPAGVGEGGGQGAQGLIVCGFAPGGVRFGFGASGEVGGGCAFDVALEPVQVAQDALVAAFPSQELGGGVGGGEVAGEAGGLGRSAAGGGGRAVAAVGDVLVVAARGLAQSDVAFGFGPVVDGHLGQFVGQQAGVEEAGEFGDGVPAVLVLAAGECAEQVDHRVRGGGHGGVVCGGGGGAARVIGSQTESLT